MLTKEALFELKAILKEDYGKDLSEDEVFQVASNLVGIFGNLNLYSSKDNEAK